MRCKVRIGWGEDFDEEKPLDDQNVATYEFETLREMEAFLLGVDEGNGWLEYEVISIEEAG